MTGKSIKFIKYLSNSRYKKGRIDLTFETGFVRAAARWTRVLHSCWLSWSRARMAELGRRKKRRRRWWKEERNRLLLVEIL